MIIRSAIISLVVMSSNFPWDANDAIFLKFRLFARNGCGVFAKMTKKTVCFVGFGGFWVVGAVIALVIRHEAWFFNFGGGAGGCCRLCIAINLVSTHGGPCGCGPVG